MIIGNPSKLSVFSLNNRDFQFTCFKKSIKLQPNNSYCYSIKTPCQLFEGCTISANTYYQRVKLVGWSKDCIDIQLNDNNQNDDDNYHDIIDINICILSSISEVLKIDHIREKYSLNSL